MSSVSRSKIKLPGSDGINVDSGRMQARADNNMGFSLSISLLLSPGF
jgi:hypothetical protein